MKWSICFLLLVNSLPVLAETMEFAEEELAVDSVRPVFETTSMVQNRNVVLKNKIEAGGSLGLGLTEALYKNLNYSIEGTYHFDEEQGVQFMALFVPQGLSARGEDLKNGKGLKSGSFNASLAPSVESLMFLNYEYSAYYGKISLSKDLNLNLSLYGTAGLGKVSFGDFSKWGLNLGLGQRIFLSSQWALKFDLRFFMYPGPDPTSVKDLNTNRPPASAFSEVTFYRTLLNVGAVWIF